MRVVLLLVPSKCRVAKKWKTSIRIAVPPADRDPHSRTTAATVGARTRSAHHAREPQHAIGCTPFAGTVAVTTGSGSRPEAIRPIGSARRRRVWPRVPELLQYPMDHPDAWLPERHHALRV